MSNDTEPTTLVIGGTGKTGRRVVERLEARGRSVRVGSRQVEPPFDWGDKGSWEPALRGVGSVYITYYPDLAVPGAAEAVGALAELAVERGTRRLVLLSGRGEEEAQHAEQTLQASGADWTIVRCSWFNQNFSENFWLEPVLAGEVALPVGDVPEPFVDADDIADVVVAALTELGHEGQLYELTGPRLLTFTDAVGEIAAATGRQLQFIPVPMDDYAAEMARQGVPSDIAWLVTYLFTEVLDGRNASVADGVERALGREARDFRDYARLTAATGVWNP